jgi:hypothetical protein
MTKVIADNTMRERLGDFSRQIELCDEHGKTLGFFVPYLPNFKPPADVVSPYTLEEVRQRAQEPGGKPLKEVWQEIWGE